MHLVNLVFPQPRSRLHHRHETLEFHPGELRLAAPWLLLAREVPGRLPVLARLHQMTCFAGAGMAFFSPFSQFSLTRRTTHIPKWFVSVFICVIGDVLWRILKSFCALEYLVNALIHFVELTHRIQLDQMMHLVHNPIAEASYDLLNLPGGHEHPWFYPFLLCIGSQGFLWI